MLLVSNYWNLHTWTCLKIYQSCWIQPRGSRSQTGSWTGMVNGKNNAGRQGNQGWCPSGPEAPLMLRQHRLGHPTRNQHKEVSHKVGTAKQTENIHVTAKQKALVILSARYSSQQHLPVELGAIFTAKLLSRKSPTQMWEEGLRVSVLLEGHIYLLMTVQEGLLFMDKLFIAHLGSIHIFNSAAASLAFWIKNWTLLQRILKGKALNVPHPVLCFKAAVWNNVKSSHSPDDYCIFHYHSNTLCPT